MSPATITLLFFIVCHCNVCVGKDSTWGNIHDHLCRSCRNRGVRLENSICRVYRQQCHFVRGNVYCRGSIV